MICGSQSSPRASRNKHARQPGGCAATTTASRGEHRGNVRSRASSRPAGGNPHRRPRGVRRCGPDRHARRLRAARGRPRQGGRRRTPAGDEGDHQPVAVDRTASQNRPTTWSAALFSPRPCTCGRHREARNHPFGGRGAQLEQVFLVHLTVKLQRRAVVHHEVIRFRVRQPHGQILARRAGAWSPRRCRRPRAAPRRATIAGHAAVSRPHAAEMRHEGEDSSRTGGTT